MDKTERWASILHTMLQCMSLLMTDFVAEVGAETWITLTLHTPNEAAAFSARALRLSTPPT